MTLIGRCKLAAFFTSYTTTESLTNHITLHLLRTLAACSCHGYYFHYGRPSPASQHLTEFR